MSENVLTVFKNINDDEICVMLHSTANPCQFSADLTELLSNLSVANPTLLRDANVMNVVCAHVITQMGKVVDNLMIYAPNTRNLDQCIIYLVSCSHASLHVRIESTSEAPSDWAHTLQSDLNKRGFVSTDAN